MTEPTLDDTRQQTIGYATDEKWSDFQLEWYFYFIWYLSKISLGSLIYKLYFLLSLRIN